VPHLGIVAENRRAIGDLADRLRIGLAHLAHHQLGAAREVGRLDGVGNCVQMSGAALGVEFFPSRLRLCRRGQHGVDLAIGCGSDGADGFERRRIDDRLCRAGHRPVVRIDEERRPVW
jgi:hypothetical protein